MAEFDDPALEFEAEPAPVVVPVPEDVELCVALEPLVVEVPVALVDVLDPCAGVDPDLVELDPWVELDPDPVELDPCVELDADPVELVFASPVEAVDELESWVWVEPELSELGFDPPPVLAVVFDLFSLVCEPEPLIARMACHQVSVEILLMPDAEDEVVLPGVVGVEVVLAAVFDALIVLAVPPLTFGCTLIAG